MRETTTQEDPESTVEEPRSGDETPTPHGPRPVLQWSTVSERAHWVTAGAALASWIALGIVMIGPPATVIWLFSIATVASVFWWWLW